MPLTQDDVKALNRPFPLEAHEWRKGRNSQDYVYITESGVVSRLNEVDPSWTLVVTDRVEREYVVARRNSKGEDYTLASHELAITVALTVKDVTRYGIGMAEVAPDAAEADKSAVTDALKRAARLFGIGAYLLNDPPQKSAFSAWLAQQGGHVEAPASNSNELSTQQVEAIKREALRFGIDKATLSQLLGITTKWGEYKDGYDEAIRRLQAYNADPR